jgi:hypothetical protein
MSALSVLKTFWAANSTLNTALPVSKIYLDWVPRKNYPYCQAVVINATPIYTTVAAHIETVTIQLSLFSSDIDALTTLAATIDGQLNNTQLDANQLIMQRINQQQVGETTDGNYVYHYILLYEMSYNSTTL